MLIVRFFSNPIVSNEAVLWKPSKSRIDPQSPQFQQNAAHNRALTGELRERLAQARSGGGELAQKRHAEQGKLFVRDRIDRLLDPGSPFLELSPLAA